MDHRNHRERQHLILQQTLTVLENDPRVLGAATTGSYASGTYDAFSDLDIACYFRDEERIGRQELHERVSALAPTLSVLYLYDLHGLYLFENGVRLDLDYKPPSALATEDRAATHILFDPDRVVARDLGRAYQPTPPAHPPHFAPGDPVYIAWFLWMFRQAYSWTKRGEQGGEPAFHKLAGAADSLHQVRTSLIAMRLWTLGEGAYLSRLDPDCTTRLAQTYPHLLPDELLAATRLLLAEFERVCPEYCGRGSTPRNRGQAAWAMYDHLGRWRA